jgi:hypothetical protein
MSDYEIKELLFERLQVEKTISQYEKIIEKKYAEISECELNILELRDRIIEINNILLSL